MRIGLEGMGLRFEPLREKHSIEEFALAIWLARPTSGDAFARAKEIGERRAKDLNLPGRGVRTQMTLSLGPGGPVPGPQLPAGTAFQRFATDGSVEEEVTIDVQGVAYRTTVYQRWRDVQNRLEQIILPVSRQLFADSPRLASMSIHYIDRFLAGDDSGVLWTELFRERPKWIVPFVLERSDLWHSHCGWFENADTDGARLLVNLNIDVVNKSWPSSDAARRSLSILTLCSYQIDPQADGTIRSDSFESEARSKFDRLHERSKELLKELLSTAYRRRIGLEGGDGNE